MPKSTSAETSPQITVRAVDRALDILLAFAKADGGLTLSDIARHVGLHKSTVHRLLTSLQQKGFVRKHSQSDKYLLGWSVLELLSNVYQSDELAAVVLPEMTHLRDITGETVSLYIRSGKERIRIQSVESNAPVRNVATIGKTYPLYIGASGKVLLAFSHKEVVDEVLSDPHLPVDFDSEGFLQQLQVIEQQGYATSVQERDDGAAAVAAPLFGRNHEFVAALSVSGPVSRFSVERMNSQVQTVVTSAGLMTKLLSH